MVMGKNNRRQEVCLNKQLVLLLSDFGWPGFHEKTFCLVKRMTEWLGIFGYSFKDAILNAVAASSTSLHLSQRTAGHQSQANTKRYTQVTAISDNLRVTSKLVIPGLHTRFGSYSDAQVILSII